MQRRISGDLPQRTVIFDFDGTLADVIPMLRHIYSEMAARRGFPEVTDEKFKELQRGSLKSAIRWIGVKPWQLPSVLNEGRKLFYQKRNTVKLFPGVKELILDLESRGCRIFILSSNSAEAIKFVLKREGVGEQIVVLKRPPLFGKAGSIGSLIKKQKLNKEDVYMIGDEVRDIDAANKAGVRGIAVTWGLQHHDILVQAKPFAVAKSVSQLQKILNS